MRHLTPQPIELRLLAAAGRLLLEYNESAGEIERILNATARAITNEEFAVAVSYEGITVSLGERSPLFIRVRELRYNASLQAKLHLILENLRSHEIDSSIALVELEHAESSTLRHSRWIAVPALGFAAASLAILLGADAVAVVTAGIATAIELVIRQELARRHFSLLTLPFAAAFIGAALGALAIRFGWTRTPGLIVIVPSLMIVPGPHLINGLFDLIDNHVPMSIARFGLASGILLASACGIVLGVDAILWTPQAPDTGATADHLTLLLDMLIAGFVTCGFAVYYNVALKHIGPAILGGMVGHGLRSLALDFGASLEAASFLGALAVGAVSAFVSRSFQVPVAVIAFAGAVTMMPGIQMFRALRGFLQLAHDGSNLQSAAATLGDASQAFLVVGALALGLVVAIRATLLLFDRLDVSAKGSVRL